MFVRRTLAMVSLASLVCFATATPARAQDVINKDGAALVKASFLHDLGHDARQVRRPCRSVSTGQGTPGGQWTGSGRCPKC